MPLTVSHENFEFCSKKSNDMNSFCCGWIDGKLGCRWMLCTATKLFKAGGSKPRAVARVQTVQKPRKLCSCLNFMLRKIVFHLYLSMESDPKSKKSLEGAQVDVITPRLLGLAKFIDEAAHIDVTLARRSRDARLAWPPISLVSANQGASELPLPKTKVQGAWQHQRQPAARKKDDNDAKIQDPNISKTAKIDAFHLPTLPLERFRDGAATL